MITLAEMGVDPWHKYIDILKDKASQSKAPVVGVTGTGGSGKSSLLDELVLRFRTDNPGKTVAVLSADPSKRRTGGALLGDRIRMNYVYGGNVYMRSLATRGSKTEVPDVIRDAISVVKAAGYDLVLVETAGIGQGGYCYSRYIGYLPLCHDRRVRSAHTARENRYVGLRGYSGAK
jgi:methylmalonyl-CoA mutase